MTRIETSWRIVSWQTTLSLVPRGLRRSGDSRAMRPNGYSAATSRLELSAMIKPYEASDTEVQFFLSLFVIATGTARDHVPAVRTTAQRCGFFFRREQRHGVPPSYFDGQSRPSHFASIHRREHEGMILLRIPRSAPLDCGQHPAVAG